jgi:RHS repeat-associated protein
MKTPLANNEGGITKNLYGYNGKELWGEMDLSINFYEARVMDASLGIFQGVDALAEKYPSHSPYCYTFDNPIRFTDPTGNEPEDDYFSRLGKYLGNDGRGNGIRIVEDINISSVTENLSKINDGVSSTQSKSKNLDQALMNSASIQNTQDLSSQSESNIILHYAEKLGIARNNFHTTNFSDSGDDFAAGGFINGKFNLKFEYGSLGKRLNNSDDITNLLVHEILGHGGDHLKGLKYNRENNRIFWDWEKRATKKTSESFILGWYF